MLIAGLLFVASMLAQDSTGTAIAKPIGEVLLEPSSGSYFQVFEFYGRPPHTQRHAAEMVRGYYYKGREGRLAYVTSGEIHYFLLFQFEKMRQTKMWIGLNVVCNDVPEASWGDGPLLENQGFKAWTSDSPQKIRESCQRREGSGVKIPVFYSPSEFGVRWEVSRANANLKYMMVEFPKPESEDPS